MLIYLKDKIKQANKNQLQNLIKKDDIQKFLEKNELGFAIEKSVKSIFDKEFGSIKRISQKNKLSMSTADVLSFRIGEKKTRSVEMFDNMVSNKADSLKFDGQLYLKSNPFARDMVSDFDLNSSNEQLNKQTQSQIGSPQIRAEQANLKTQTFQNVTNGNKFSVLEAQFSSRIAAAVLEQAINSKENFDLILEPESFGKVRVNISLESLQLDVKLTAENNATLAILRASEAVLQSITELNGLKLAEYSVELNSGTQNNGGSKEQQDNNGQNQRRASDQLENSDDNLEPLIDEGSHSLNLIA
jgi:flagellar hook-length control protein FliK